jgi:hypothetical protein
MSVNKVVNARACFKIQMILKLNELRGIHALKKRMYGMYGIYRTHELISKIECIE